MRTHRHRLRRSLTLGVRICGGNNAVYELGNIATLIADGRYRPPATTTYALDQAVQGQQQSMTGHLSGRKTHPCRASRTE